MSSQSSGEAFRHLGRCDHRPRARGCSPSSKGPCSRQPAAGVGGELLHISYLMLGPQARSQIGDRTNLVLILAGELLKSAESLINLGLHPSEIIAGYELARDKVLEELGSASSRPLL